MKTTCKGILILCVLTTCFGACNFKRNATHSLKVLTYNIYNGKGLDGHTDYRRISDVINGCQPDVAAIQELDSMTQRSNLYVLAEIAGQVNMYYSYCASFERQGGGKFGNGVLSKEKPLGSRSIPLPGRDEARSLLIVEFKDYVFCSTHLSQNAADRLSSIPLINEQLKDIKKPVILGGDLNAVPTSRPVRELTQTWTILNDTAGYTIPPVNPDRCIDYVLLKSTHTARVKESQVISTQAAAWHLPLLVEIEF